ncbi:MAG: HAMP domain-containing histidine kinase [Defluviitaleaceae bacterium]|nr:HAMP domain-containing histidine kinase [Defluviitaleaceae bacterium]
MIIRRKEIEQLSADIRRIIDGQAVDIRDNLEGRLSILKNDIHALADRLNEQAGNLQKEKNALADTLADISHQLKTPLTAVMVMVELLEDAPPEKASEFITHLKQGLTQTGWLVNSLLKIAKLDSGSVVFSPVSISASSLLNLALQPLQILLDIKSQQVNLTGEAEFLCDKNWTAEALTNIIKNASEHSPEGSIIEISAGVNPLTSWLSVTDNGKGISTAEIKSLFRRFGGSQQGTGIGLPLALAIMHGQNGDMEVDGGGNGQGATFTLKFYSD